MLAMTTDDRAGRRDDGGDAPGGERRCAVTREVAPREGLVRFVVGPDGTLVPDIAEKLPGRGLWMRARREVIGAADAARLGRAARCRVSVPDDLADRVERLLAARCLETIGLARRAGQAVAGFEKVREWLRAGRGHVIVCAADAGSDGRRRLAALGVKAARIEALRGDELGAAFGRDRSVFVVLAEGRLAGRLREDAAKLAGMRGLPVTELNDDLNETV